MTPLPPRPRSTVEIYLALILEALERLDRAVYQPPPENPPPGPAVRKPATRRRKGTP